MTYEEIQNISYLRRGISTPTDKVDYHVEDGVGFEHPLWTILNAKFPPVMPWNRLRGAERGQIVKAGKILHNNNIPYSYYANYLKRFNKGFLMHKSPLLITGFKEKKSGAHPILSDFISVVNILVDHFDKNETTLRVLEQAYHTFKNPYEGGPMHMVFACNTIAETLGTESLMYITKVMGASKTLEEFTEKLGKKKLHEHIVQRMEGSESQASKVLVTELRVRRGRAEGKPDPKLNKYFNKNNTLNVRGLKLVSEA